MSVVGECMWVCSNYKNNTYIKVHWNWVLDMNKYMVIGSQERSMIWLKCIFMAISLPNQVIISSEYVINWRIFLIMQKLPFTIGTYLEALGWGQPLFFVFWDVVGWLHVELWTRVDHSKAFLCTTCGWGFFVLGLFTFKCWIKVSLWLLKFQKWPICLHPSFNYIVQVTTIFCTLYSF